VPESIDYIMFFSVLHKLPFLWVWRRRWWTVFPSLSSFYTRCPQRIVTRCNSAFFLCSVLRFLCSHENWAYWLFVLCLDRQFYIAFQERNVNLQRHWPWYQWLLFFRCFCELFTEDFHLICLGIYVTGWVECADFDTVLCG